MSKGWIVLITRLPDEGPLQIGSVSLPAGVRIVSGYGTAQQPVAWATTEPVPAPACGSWPRRSCPRCARRTRRCPASGPGHPAVPPRSTASSRWPARSRPWPGRRARRGAGQPGSGAGLIRAGLRVVRGTDIACRSGGVVWMSADHGRGSCGAGPPTWSCPARRACWRSRHSTADRLGGQRPSCNSRCPAASAQDRQDLIFHGQPGAAHVGRDDLLLAL